MAILAAAHCTTDCASTSDATGMTPLLPLELIQMVIDWAVVDFSATKEGGLLCALMHTSCLVRSIVVQAFEP